MQLTCIPVDHDLVIAAWEARAKAVEMAPEDMREVSDRIRQEKYAIELGRLNQAKLGIKNKSVETLSKG
jgi:ribosomal protein L22